MMIYQAQASILWLVCVLLAQQVLASNSQWYVNGSASNTASLKSGFVIRLYLKKGQVGFLKVIGFLQ